MTIASELRYVAARCQSVALTAHLRQAADAIDYTVRQLYFDPSQDRLRDAVGAFSNGSRAMRLALPEGDPRPSVAPSVAIPPPAFPA